MRGEIKFAGADALVAQLKRDEQNTRDYYVAHPFVVTPRIQVAQQSDRLEAQ
jgi:riboflavin kinase / FMN adenylyltransferase